MKYKNFIIALGLTAMGGSMESCNGCSSNKDEVTELISPYEEDDDLEIELPDEDVVDVSYTEQSNLKIVQVLINDRINKEMIFGRRGSFPWIAPPHLTTA